MINVEDFIQESDGFVYLESPVWVSFDKGDDYIYFDGGFRLEDLDIIINYVKSFISEE